MTAPADHPLRRWRATSCRAATGAREQPGVVIPGRPSVALVRDRCELFRGRQLCQTARDAQPRWLAMVRERRRSPDRRAPPRFRAETHPLRSAASPRRHTFSATQRSTLLRGMRRCRFGWGAAPCRRSRCQLPANRKCSRCLRLGGYSDGAGLATRHAAPQALERNAMLREFSCSGFTCSGNCACRARGSDTRCTSRRWERRHTTACRALRHRTKSKCGSRSRSSSSSVLSVASRLCAGSLTPRTR